MAISVRSYAKINLGLYIGPPGLRADGFHELRTVYQTIALHDVVRVGLASGTTEIQIRCADPRVPADESNTCWKAAERVLKALKLRGRVSIDIDKRLPVEGGMGAASSNAVATMLGIERAAKKELSASERLRIAEEVGSDVPLFLIGGTVLGIGRGEQVFALPDIPKLNLVVVTPNVGVSTPKAFAAWDELFEDSDPRLTVSRQLDKLNTFSHEVHSWLSTVRSGVAAKSSDRAEALLLDLVRTGIENDFERVVFPQFPEIRDVKRAIERAGSEYALLSGSGSTVFGIFRTQAAAALAAKSLNAQGVRAQATATISRADCCKA